DEPVLQEIALSKAAETIEKWNADVLSKALDEYTTQTGKLPASINDLATMPALQNYETGSMSRLIADTIRVGAALSKRPLEVHQLARYAPPDPILMNQP